MFKKARYVYAVYTEESFTRAAQKLYVSQPCLSAAIRQIEQQVGSPLFERSALAVKPTELGLEYIKIAGQIMALEDGFAARVKDINALSCGTVRVGGSNYMSSYILPRVIDAFSKKFPHVTVSLTEASSSELAVLLQNQEIDLIVDSFDAEPQSCTYHPLLTERILLAVPASYSCNEKIKSFAMSPALMFDQRYDITGFPAVPIECFHGEKFILLKHGNSMYDHAMAIFRKGGFTPTVSLFLDQLSTSYFLTTQGNGICFVTDTVFRYHKFENAVCLYHIKESGTRTLGLAHKKGRHITPAVEKFMEIAEAVIKDTACSVM